MHNIRGRCAVECHSFVESDSGGFEQKPLTVEVHDYIPARIEDLVLELDKDTLRVGLSCDVLRTGQPKRRQALHAVTLSPGTVARLVTNGRHTSYSGQWYTQNTYNVALGDDVDADVFISRQPEHMFSQEADLF
jgi:hypothetical protein